MIDCRCALTGIVALIYCCCCLHAQDDLQARQSVVKVFSKSTRVSTDNPWKRDAGSENSGSGIWLGDQRVLTNEHVVRYTTELSIQPYESAERVPADVVFTSPEMDLAIIQVDEEFPIEGLTPAQFSQQLPALQSKVQVYGFPEGGDSLSVSEGIISRIEYRPYSYEEYGMRIQIDAAINPGNSGGPAYVGDEIVGIAFQKLSHSDNIGYLIPSEEVLRILEVAEAGSDVRKPTLPMVYQRLVNPDLRRKLGLDRETTGVWVRKLVQVEEDYPVQVGDILTHIAEHEIDNNGNARLSDDLQVFFECFVLRLLDGGTVPITLLRGGEKLSVDAPAWIPPRPLLVPLKGGYPDYFVFGPIVFTTAYDETLSALETALQSDDPRVRRIVAGRLRFMMKQESPFIARRGDLPEFDGEELVLVAKMLPHRVTVGYGSPYMQVVQQVNGVRIRNLRHLVAVIRDLGDEFIEIEFDGPGESIVLERANLIEATDEVLLNYGIARQGSPEIMKIWSSSE